MIGNPYVLLGAGVVVIGLVTGAYFTGREHEGNARDAAQLVAERAAQDLIDQQAAASAAATGEVASNTEAELDQARDVTTTLLSEIPNVENNDNAAVPAGLGRLWYDSIRGELPGIPIGTGQPYGLTPSVEYAVFIGSLVTTDIINNGKHHQCRATLIGLQTWVTRQEEIWKQYAVAGN